MKKSFLKNFKKNSTLPNYSHTWRFQEIPKYLQMVLGPKYLQMVLGKKTVFHANFIQNYHQQAQCDVLYYGVLN